MFTKMKMGGDKVDNKIKTVAFDLGGVLAYQDITPPKNFYYKSIEIQAR